MSLYRNEFTSVSTFYSVTIGGLVNKATTEKMI